MPTSLMARLRLVFLLLILLMVGLLAYQLTTAGKMLSHEARQQQEVLFRSLNTWLMSEARYHMALAKGVEPYALRLGDQLEMARDERLGTIVKQLYHSLPFSGVLLIDPRGRGWNHKGQVLSHVSWPEWMKRLRVRHIALKLVRHDGLPRVWRALFPQTGVYSIVKMPIYRAGGAQAGTLVLVRRLAVEGQRVAYLSNMQGMQVTLALTPPVEDVVTTPLRLLQAVLSASELPIWVAMPTFVEDRGQAGFVWHQPTTFFQDMLRSSLIAVLMPFGIFFIALSGLFWYLSHQVVGPLARLAALFERLGQGARGERMPPGRYVDEVAYVVDQTNDMLDRLDEREQALQALNSTLEQQVRERTRQVENANRRLRELAYIDPLTSLNNRLRFEQRWRDLYPHEGLILALVDIDFFHDLNEVYGTEVGNRVLQRVAETLRHVCGEDVEVFRLEADEFALLFDASRHSGAEAQRCLEDLQRRFAQTPLRELGLSAPLMLSVGWVEVSGDSDLPLNTVLRQALIAKRAAKNDLYRKVQRFDPVQHRDETVISPQAMHDLVRMVREGDGLMLMCQPLVSVSEGAPVYAEVLARFARDGQIIPPGQFFPLVERAGLQAAFDEQVLAKVADWLRRADFSYRGVSLNLTPEALAHEQLFDWLAPLAPLTKRHKIVLEITESTLIQDVAAAQEKLKHFRRLGFKVAIDDFGSGYSSISYLAHLSADVIKFDRSLAVAAFEDARSARIVLGLAEELATLGYEVVFEGIETEEMARFFSQPFVHYLQGFYFARPAPCSADK